jgi:transposase
LTKCLTKICSHLKMQQKPRGKKHRMCFEQIDISDEMVCVGG